MRNSRVYAQAIDRRSAVSRIFGGCVVCGLFSSTHAMAIELPRYCAMDPSSQLSALNPRSSTGDAALDRALIAEMRSIMSVIPVNPGIRIIDDGRNPNAFAMDQNLIPGTRGTILFGITLLTSELRAVGGGYAVAGIAAHECAHIFQFTTNYARSLTGGQRTAKAMELHADFLAGYYLARDKANSIQIRTFAQSLFSKGDQDYNNPRHHGTPQQRVRSMEEGYSAASKNVEFAQAAELGARIVMSL